MEEQKPAMLRIISTAVGLASKAGLEVRRITKTGQLGVVDKGVQDFQTEADRTAQRLIVTSLARRFPKCVIVGEEDLVEDKAADDDLMSDIYEPDILNMNLPAKYLNLTEEDITIWVDPLDGTKEFVNGFLDHVTVLIGISVEGKSVAGVIHQPFFDYKSGNDKGRTIWGLVGMGCYGITPRKLPDDKLIVTTTASHGNVNIEECIAALKPDQILKVGGAGHKVLLVIEGKAHSYVFASNGCKRWDTSAPEAVLESAGGRLTDCFGNRIDYAYNTSRDYQNRRGIIASANPRVHSKILANIPAEVKKRLQSAL